MTKSERKKKFPVLSLTAIAILGLLLLFAVPKSLDRVSGPQVPAAETTSPPSATMPSATSPSVPTPSVPTPSVSATEPAQTEPSVDMHGAEALSFPLMADNDRLRIEAPFSYDGINPDCDFSESRNVAAFVLQNMSGQHLLQADLTLTLSDGSRATFRAEHIPSGKRAIAFALDNTQLPADARWVGFDCTAQYAPSDAGAASAVRISTDGVLIRVTNVTSAPIEQLVIYCHDLLGEEYWGGKAYSYEVQNLTAGETVTVEALDCILGLTEAAYIDGIYE